MSFKFNKEKALQKVTTGGAFIDTSGCYAVKIEKATIAVGSQEDASSESEALVLNVATGKKDGNLKANFIRIGYLKKDGTENVNGYAIVSQLVELAGKEDQMENFPACLEGVTIGAFIEVKGEEYKGTQKTKREIRGFYDRKSLLTAYEMNEGESHLTHDAFKDRWKDAKPVAYTKSKTRTAEDTVREKQNAPVTNGTADDDEEFPF